MLFIGCLGKGRTMSCWCMRVKLLLLQIPPGTSSGCQSDDWCQRRGTKSWSAGYTIMLLMESTSTSVLFSFGCSILRKGPNFR